MLPFKFQDATYWASPVPNGFGGHTFAAPVQIKVRWEDKTEEFLTALGEPVFSQSVLYIDQDIDIGGYMFLGTSLTADPTTVEGAFPVKRFAKTPSLRNAEYERKAWL